MIDKHPLKVTAVRVLEDWAMMLVDPADPVVEVFDPKQKFYMSWVDIDGGEIKGALFIVAQESFIKTLATNLLGIDDQVSITEGQDAFKEMANVLTGNFITEAFGDDVVFDILRPSVSEISLSELDRFVKRKIVFAFLADDAPVAVTFSIRDETSAQGTLL